MSATLLLITGILMMINPRLAGVWIIILGLISLFGVRR